MAGATLTVTPKSITLRIRFPDDAVIRIMESQRQFKLTTSSPALLAALKTDEPVYHAYYALHGIKTANLVDETSLMKMQRFRAMAEQSNSLIEFVRNAGLRAAPLGEK